LEWLGIQRALAPEVGSVVYDRAGLGWSDPAPGPRRLGVMVDELHTVLSASGVTPPYVLAGHSIGGLVALGYAARYPSDIAALALIDSSHPEMFERITLGGVVSLRLSWLLRAARLCLTPLGLRRLAAAGDDLRPQYRSDRVHPAGLPRRPAGRAGGG
jgi:pimeloyl-ACP methyl ester carboxylesterase